MPRNLGRTASRGTIGAAVLACGWLVSAAAQTVPADAPMAPSGAWVAAFEEKTCVLSRAYGAAEAGIQLGFRPMPGDRFIEMVVVSAHSGRPFYRTGMAEVTLLPSGQRTSVQYRDYIVKGGGTRVLRLYVPSDEITDLKTARSIRLQAGKGAPFHFALRQTAAAMKTIQTCQDDLMRSWGFDPEAVRAVAKPAEPKRTPQYWVSNSDYPDEALSKRMQGAVRFRLTVEADGSVSDCQLNESSGWPLLDANTCTVLRKKARFLPAIGADGKPVRMPWSSTFNYSLPGHD